MGGRGSAVKGPYGVRRIVKWAISAASAAALLLWIASAMGRGVSARYGQWEVAASRSCLRVSYYEPVARQQPLRVETYTLPPRWSSSWVKRLGLIRPRIDRSAPEYMCESMIFPGVQCLVIPCWMPSVALLVASAGLWWRDRRRFPAGHCWKCGYNLTGNVSGVCSECGSAIEIEEVK